MLDNIGVPVSGINLTYDSSDPIGPEDADILLTLKHGIGPTSAYVAKLRNVLDASFPGVTFSFLPADIVSQILNFGLPAPIDIQIVGSAPDNNRVVANRLLAKLRSVRGLVDARIQQPGDEPAIDVDVDRTKAIQAGLTQRDVAQNLLIALSGSSQTTPNFWLDPKNGVSYPLMAEVPQYDIHSLQTLANIPVTTFGPATGPQNLLGTLGVMSRTHAAGCRLALQRAARARHLRVDARTGSGRRRDRRVEARRRSAHSTTARFIYRDSRSGAVDG